jgi:asparagine synthase (glutamine-hydrolysing)
MAHANEDLVRQGYKAFGEGDMDTLRSMFAPDAVHVATGNNPLAGEYKGFTPQADPPQVGSLPVSAKIGLWTTKKPLRHLLRSRYPSSITNQPKKGFGIPVSRWLRTVARDSVEEVLPKLPVDQGAVSRLWTEHLTGRRNHRMPLWALYVFGLWEKRSEAAV